MLRVPSPALTKEPEAALAWLAPDDVQTLGLLTPGGEGVVNWSLAAALLTIAALAVGWLTTAVEPDRPTARMIASTLAAGSVIAAVTQVAYLGAEDRVLAVGDVREFDPAPLATMIDAIGRTDDYVENLGFLLIAVAVTAMGLGTTSANPGRPRMAGGLLGLVSRTRPHRGHQLRRDRRKRRGATGGGRGTRSGVGPASRAAPGWTYRVTVLGGRPVSGCGSLPVCGSQGAVTRRGSRGLPSS